MPPCPSPATVRAICVPIPYPTLSFPHSHHYPCPADYQVGPSGCNFYSCSTRSSQTMMVTEIPLIPICPYGPALCHCAQLSQLFVRLFSETYQLTDPVYKPSKPPDPPTSETTSGPFPPSLSWISSRWGLKHKDMSSCGGIHQQKQA